MKGLGGKGLVHAFLGGTLKYIRYSLGGTLEHTTNTTELLAQRHFIMNVMKI